MAKKPGFLPVTWHFSSLFCLPLLIFGQQGLDESFNPTSLRDWPGASAQIEQIHSLEQVSAAEPDSLPLFEEKPDFIFMVQLFSTTDYEQAVERETAARYAFDEEVLTTFDSPYYKIRVGRLNNREDAQALQALAVKSGYRRAWVVRTENDTETN